MRKKWMFLLSVVILASMFLTACGPPAEVTERVVTQVVKVEETSVSVVKETAPPVEVVVTPTPVPVDRKGAWVDSVIVVEEPSSAAAITRLEVGEIDVFAYTVADRELFKRVQESPNLTYAQSYGSYNEMTLNPAGPVFSATNKLNPFAVPAMREALNWLIDRDYICQEIYGGLAVPRYTAINTSFPDYAKLADVARKLELNYAYNPDRAKEVFDAEMVNIGATMEGDKWMYNGEPVEIIVLIRTEDERRAIGDYVANQLESIGFTTVRDYKTSAEASPIWMRGNPNDGLWHVYTGGWVSTAINRDVGSNFDFFYTDRGLPVPLWQAYTPAPDFDEVSLKLAINDFTSIEERTDLFRQALDMSMKDSVRVWLIDRVSFAPYRNNVEVASDLAGSIYGSRLWTATLRRVGEIGGSMTIAMPSILTEPWNAVAGSNWIYDQMLIRGTGDNATVSDPYTGLPLPNRIERAEVVVQTGLPVGKTHDWIDLQFADEIVVPDDAWVDWDAANQRFITAAEKYTQTQTALTKAIVYYPASLYDLKWHDGSNFSIGDVMMYMILYNFDRAKPESALYDEAEVPNYESFMSHFKGVRILSEDPLVIETYDDLWYLDAEYIITTWFPTYNQGEASWHALTLGILADSAGQLAFSADKADALGVEYMSYIAGPSIEILKSKLDYVMTSTLIPYEPTMGQYVSADEATTRYTNLSEWYRTKGHFWVGTGLFYLERAFPVEGTVVLKRNLYATEPADRWAKFSAPRLATVEVDGSDRVSIGAETTFDVFITFGDEPYPVADVEQVKYMVFDAKGELAFVGEATAVADGQWEVKLGTDVTSKLEAGSNRLEIAVVPIVVSIPAFGSFQFVTAP